MMRKNKHRKNKKPKDIKKTNNIITKISRGYLFAMVGTGKSGIQQKDQKQYKNRKERRNGKKIDNFME